MKNSLTISQSHHNGRNIFTEFAKGYSLKKAIEKKDCKVLQVFMEEIQFLCRRQDRMHENSLSKHRKTLTKVVTALVS